MIYEDKRAIVIFFVFFAIVLSLLFYTNNDKLEHQLDTMNYVDVEKYTGVWYSIYEIPNNFQNNCECVTAEYGIVDEDTISVLNTCGNTNKTIKGSADIINKVTNSELEVDFGFFIKGDYNIIYVDKDYKYAIVGSKNRDYLWFLSRDTTIPETQLDIMRTIVEYQDYDYSIMRKVEHTCNLK